ncbi:hypothetical protein ACS0TY_032195 [Phlomoides rotata]
MLFHNNFSKFIALFIVLALFQEPALAIKKSYIVYLGAHSHGQDVTTADLDQVTVSHTQLLASFLGSIEKASGAIFYSYKKHINGFAALLEDEEAKEIAKNPNVVSVFPNEAKKLHTTHSWDFLNLERNESIHPSSIWKKARFGEDIIIANLDTGVWPESKSFSGVGYGPIPRRWKGVCQVEKSPHLFCNSKLIGARYFNKGYASFHGQRPLNSSFHTPRDPVGHGSHTLSTAAGNFVPGASIFGVANGTAKGGAPRARAATYKVCWSDTDCYDADILEGFETAIDDGVDVLSVSLGGATRDYLLDTIAIGSFHAVKKGITVVASAGNSGPILGSVGNVAPWILTVAASTIDREIQANVRLNNGSFFKGTSLSKPFPTTGFYPLVYGGDAGAHNVSVNNAILCQQGALDPKKVKAKIVVCLRGGNSRVGKGVEAARAGAAGMILANGKADGNEILSDAHVLPATHISYKDGLILLHYINSTKDPKGLITSPKTVLNVKPSPFMASFSSRGPNTITPEILKPDITAPGVSVIAAYSEAVSATGEGIAPFNALSGTSMSCPHVSGVVGLLKTLHPDWSPAAIKSAIMTTARSRDNTENPIRDSDNTIAGPFSYGSGHIRPNRAVDPGLVYDLSINDYLDFLCGIGYSQTSIKKISGSGYKCPGKRYNILNFNYPSISVHGTTTVTRKVKNVGPPATYKARVWSPDGYLISVEPSVLRFEKTGEEKSFKVSIKAPTSTGKNEYKYGHFTWSDGSHYVRSPVVMLPLTRPN